jgi:hypothetical protein
VREGCGSQRESLYLRLFSPSSADRSFFMFVFSFIAIFCVGEKTLANSINEDNDCVMFSIDSGKTSQLCELLRDAFLSGQRNLESQDRKSRAFPRNFNLFSKHQRPNKSAISFDKSPFITFRKRSRKSIAQLTKLNRSTRMIEGKIKDYFCSARKLCFSSKKLIRFLLHCALTFCLHWLKSVDSSLVPL